MVDALARAMWQRGDALSRLGRHGDAISVLEAATRILASAGRFDDELRAELSTLRAITAADPLDARLRPRLEAAYAVACALDRNEPRRSGAMRAAVWADLQALDARQALSVDAFDHAAEYLFRIARRSRTISAYVALQ